MRREGRKVGKLVQDAVTGYWREEAPARTSALCLAPRGALAALDTGFIVEAFENGFTRGEVTKIVREAGAGAEVSIATLYKQVDNVLLAAGHRARAERSRRGGRRSGSGEAALPAVLEGLR